MTITLEVLRDALGWCALMNIGILLFWFIMISFANDYIYRIHSSLFRISKKRFDAIHYQGMMFFKVGVFMFNIIPYLALRIVG
jgi:hypothetical protein